MRRHGTRIAPQWEAEGVKQRSVGFMAWVTVETGADLTSRKTQMRLYPRPKWHPILLQRKKGWEHQVLKLEKGINKVMCNCSPQRPSKGHAYVRANALVLHSCPRSPVLKVQWEHSLACCLNGRLFLGSEIWFLPGLCPMQYTGSKESGWAGFGGYTSIRTLLYISWTTLKTWDEKEIRILRNL